MIRLAVMDIPGDCDFRAGGVRFGFFRKEAFFKPRLRKLLYCFLALLVSAGVLFFPFEYWTEGFPSAEAALRFSSPAMMFSSFEVVEGENSVFALSENREMGGANIAIVGKSGQGWSGVEVEDMSPCKTAHTAQADVELYECSQENFLCLSRQ